MGEDDSMQSPDYAEPIDDDDEDVANGDEYAQDTYEQREAPAHTRYEHTEQHTAQCDADECNADTSGDSASEQYIDEYAEYDPDNDEELDEEYNEYNEYNENEYAEYADAEYDEYGEEEYTDVDAADEIDTEAVDAATDVAEDDVCDAEYAELFHGCQLKLDALQRRHSASSVVELRLKDRMINTMSFAALDMAVCLWCCPRKSRLGALLWSSVWAGLAALSFAMDQASPLFIVLAMNAAFPFLGQAS